MEDCVFCDPMACATNGILYEDEVVMAFRDINPRAAIHVLVVPKQHIKNSSELNEKHISLVQYMVTVGKRVLVEQCQVMFADALAPVQDHKFGFHQYPFNSVNHLHLHCIVPPYKHCWSRLRYTESCVGHYVSADSLVESLRLG